MDRLHHMGFVVPSIGDAVDRFIAGMGLRWDGQVFHDPIQTVRVTFLEHCTPEAPMIELVEPASPQSRVAGFLKRGGGLHHLCYEVDSLDARIESALASGAALLLPPAEAVAFAGRRIAWVCTPDRLFVEYLERRPPAPLASQ
ncbi:MAG: VOC family protein [Bryobacteraceae bacterium]